VRAPGTFPCGHGPENRMPGEIEAGDAAAAVGHHLDGESTC
jgi:hypothetical protein